MATRKVIARKKRRIENQEEQQSQNPLQSQEQTQSDSVMWLQRTIGNRATGRLLSQASQGSIQREGDEATNVPFKEKLKFFQNTKAKETRKQEIVIPRSEPGDKSGVMSFQESIKFWNQFAGKKKPEVSGDKKETPPDTGTSSTSMDMTSTPDTTSTPTPDTTTTDTTSTPTDTTSTPDITSTSTPDTTSTDTTTPDTTTSESTSSTTVEPEAPKGHGSYYSKSNKDDWKGPEGLVSLGKKKGSLRGKSLETLFINEEKSNYNSDTGMARAEWAGKGVYVKYINDKADRDSYELKLQKGKNIFFWRGAAIDTSTMERANIFGGSIKQEDKARVIFVMTTGGRIYVADEGQEAQLGRNDPELYWRFNHSSLVAGEPIASAGEMWFEKGVLKGINNSSGHYKPDVNSIMLVLRQFDNAGVDISGIDIEIRDPSNNIKKVPAHEVLKDGYRAIKQNVRSVVSSLEGDAELGSVKSAALSLETALGRDSRAIKGKNSNVLIKLYEGLISVVDDKLMHDEPLRVYKSGGRDVLYALETLNDTYPGAIGEGAIDAVTEIINMARRQDEYEDMDTDDLTDLLMEKGKALKGLLTAQQANFESKINEIISTQDTNATEMKEGITEAFNTFYKDKADAMGDFDDLHQKDPELFRTTLRDYTLKRGMTFVQFAKDYLLLGAQTARRENRPSLAVLTYKLAEELSPGSSDGVSYTTIASEGMQKAFSAYKKGKRTIDMIGIDFYRSIQADPEAMKKALPEMLAQEEMNMGKFIDDILIKGAEANVEDKDYSWAVKLYQLANELQPGSVSEETITTTQALDED